MRGNADPLAWVAFGFTRVFGWFFFNYHGRPWRGQLVRKISNPIEPAATAPPHLRRSALA
jgi:hypothetical protein